MGAAKAADADTQPSNTHATVFPASPQGLVTKVHIAGASSQQAPFQTPLSPHAFEVDAKIPFPVSGAVVGIGGDPGASPSPWSLGFGPKGEGRMRWAEAPRMPASFGFLKAKQPKSHPTEPIPALGPAPFLLKEGWRSIP